MPTLIIKENAFYLIQLVKNTVKESWLQLVFNAIQAMLLIQKITNVFQISKNLVIHFVKSIKKINALFALLDIIWANKESALRLILVAKNIILQMEHVLFVMLDLKLMQVNALKISNC